MKNTILYIAVFYFMCGIADAACTGPTTNSSFGTSFYQAKTVTGFIYDTDYDKMYVMIPGNTYSTYMNVPYSIAYNFSSTNYAPTTRPDTFYAQQIVPIYHAALETNTCLQLVTNDGTYITVD